MYRNVETFYYYDRPSRINAGSDGAHAGYDPGALHTYTISSGASYSNAIDIDFSPGRGWGSGSFHGAMEHSSTSNISNAMEFRPASQIPWIYRFYRYSTAAYPSSFPYEYYSCEFKSGWSGTPCSTYGY
jgi:hypothetical protein